MSLPITITTAGLNALINAQNTGGSSVVIAQIGVSATQVAVTAATAAIPGEIKRLGGVAGLVVADDTIHVSAADQSADTYTVRTIALYLDTGVLFAAYSQAGVLFEKASAAMIVLDADVQLSTALAEVIEFTGGGWTNPPATETILGVVRLATDAEVTAGVNDTRAVTPKKLATRLASLMAGVTASFDAVAVALAGKAATAHSHDASAITSGVFNVARLPSIAISGVTGLVDALAGKAAAVHSHVMADITGLAAALALKATLGADVIFNVVTLGTGSGKIYGDGGSNNVVVATGIGSAIRYFAFGVDGSFNALSGPLLNQGSPVWHSANFNPAAKLSQSIDAHNSRNDPGAAQVGFDGMDLNLGDGLVGYHLLTKNRPDSPSYGFQLAIGDTSESLFYRRKGDGAWLPWQRIWTSHTFNPADKANALHTHDWTQVTGKPSLALTDGTGIILGGPAVGVAVRVNGSDYRYLPEIASSAEVAAGVEGSRAVTPATLWSSARSISGSGYLQIPGTPLIMQWGVVTASAAEGAVHVPLPVAFGGGCLVALATARNPAQGLGRDYTMQVVGRFLDRIAFFANRANDNAGNSQGFEWWALGLASGTPDPVYSAGSIGNPGGGGGDGTIEP